MDALVMCGGRGTRLDVPVEKPLFEIDGRPMIDAVVSACADSGVDTVYAVVSPHVPETRSYLETQPVERLATPGEGYVDDLNRARETVDPPVLTVAADLPLLAAEHLDDAMSGHEGGSLTVCVPVALKELLDLSVDLTLDRPGASLAPTGLNVVADGGPDDIEVTYDARLAVNVNRPTDAQVAERLR